MQEVCLCERERGGGEGGMALTLEEFSLTGNTRNHITCCALILMTNQESRETDEKKCFPQICICGVQTAGWLILV